MNDDPLIAEARKRGLLPAAPAEDDALLAEAKKRGILPDQQGGGIGEFAEKFVSTPLAKGASMLAGLPRAAYDALAAGGTGYGAERAGDALMAPTVPQLPQAPTPDVLPSTEGTMEKLRQLGVPMREAETPLGRVAQDALAGGVAGGPFGAAGAAYGALSGAGATGAAELGLPEWAQTAAAVGLPLLGGRLASAGGRAIKGAPKVPTTAEVRAQADAAYAKGDKSGMRVKPQAAQNVVNQLESELYKKGYRPEVHTDISSAIKASRKMAEKGLGVQDLTAMREMYSDLAGNALGSNSSRLGIFMKKRLDDFMENKIQIPGVKEGRKLYSQAKRSEMLETAIERAGRKAGRAGTGGNFENALRQEVDSIINNPRKAARFSDADLKALDTFVRGGGMRNFARRLFVLAPSASKLLMSGHGAAAILSGGWTIPLSVAGEAIKATTELASKRGLQSIAKDIRRGGPAPKPSIPLLPAPGKALLVPPLVEALMPPKR